jgi:hypothetical protein
MQGMTVDHLKNTLMMHGWNKLMLQGCLWNTTFGYSKSRAIRGVIVAEMPSIHMIEKLVSMNLLNP